MKRMCLNEKGSACAPRQPRRLINVTQTHKIPDKRDNRNSSGRTPQLSHLLLSRDAGILTIGSIYSLAIMWWPLSAVSHHYFVLLLFLDI